MLIVRFLNIIFTIFRYGLDGEINPSLLPWYLKFFCYLLPGRYLFSRETRGERITKAIESLGPVFIKFGQILSTRPDLLPADIFSKLSALQDNTKSFSSDQAVAILTNAFGEHPDKTFKSFSSKPLASASIAQVHRATLHTGQDVVVKIVRPNIERLILRDLKGMHLVAKIMTWIHPDGKRIHPIAVVRDYKNTILNELDLLQEAANTNNLRDNFKHSNDFYVPEVYWKYCRKKILCLEYISAIPMGNIEELKAAGVDFKRLSERAVNIFFTQFLVHNFFHADMHPGNIFVDASNPQDPTFIGIDCAIMGSLEHKETIVMAQLLHNIFNRDYMQAAEIFVRNKWVSEDTNTAVLAGAIRACNEPVFAMPMSEISFSQQLLMLFMTGRRFDMQVQPSLILLQKTLFNIEGLGNQLYPELDLWETAKPFIDNWIKKHYSPLGVIKRNAKYFPELLDAAPQLIENAINNKHNASPDLTTTATNDLSTKKLLALLSIGAVSLTSAYQPELISQLPKTAWLLSGVFISWLWLS